MYQRVNLGSTDEQVKTAFRVDTSAPSTFITSAVRGGEKKSIFPSIFQPFRDFVGTFEGPPGDR
jgi:hypothetical protein